MPTTADGTLKNVLSQIRAFLAVSTRYAFRSPSKYSTARFGKIQRLLFIAGQDATYVEKLDLRINLWTDAEIMSWKTSLITNCNSISVAAAIFASIGLTAMQLPGISQTHWTAQAFLAASMGVGILSVVCATNLQRNIIMCNTPLEIRLWLSHGNRSVEVPYDDPFTMLPLESSLSAAVMCELPAQMLEFAVILYFVGFGLYLLFSWTNKVEVDPRSARNVFIFFVVVIGFFGLQKVYGQAMRDLDQVKRNKEFAPNDSTAFVQCQTLKHLEDWLEILREGQGQKGPDQQEGLVLGPDQAENVAMLKQRIDALNQKWAAEQLERDNKLKTGMPLKFRGNMLSKTISDPEQGTK